MYKILIILYIVTSSNHYLYIIVIFALIIVQIAVPLLAQSNFKRTAHKYAQKMSSTNVAGINLISEMFDFWDIPDFKVTIIPGNFTDNYNFKTNILNLSHNSYHGSSISNHAVACHEAGHAVQFRKNFVWAEFSKKITNFMQIVTMFNIIFFFIWIFTNNVWPLYAFTALTSIIFLYQLNIVIIEYDATRRGLKFMKNSAYFENAEIKAARNVLLSAWMTYWALTFVYLMEIGFGIFLILYFAS